MGSDENHKIGAVVLRIVLFTNLIAIMAYGTITPYQMSKVTAECVTIGIAGLAMAVQTYVTLAVYTRFHYKVSNVIGLDGLYMVDWLVAIVVLSNWVCKVVYLPRNGDPAAWLQCANADNRDKVLTSDGVGHWIHLVWCEVEVDKRRRLIGNIAARQQLHVLIGLFTVPLLFTGLILLWTVRRGQYLGLVIIHK